MTKEDNAGAPTLSEMADRGRISHLHAAFHPVNAQYDFAIGTLPYPPSNGPWLERLCFLLLRTQGYVPRYFGNVGQKDRGVDLLVTTGDQLFVYQCKNVQSFSSSDMLKALKDFEDEWLKSSGLPKPNKFILCCPSLLRERVANEKWTKLERDFRSRTGVEVEYWHRNYLDETLKFMPDIVAEVFSDQIAKLFCERDDWNYDQFAPVAADSPDRYIKRYQERKSTDRIYLDPDLAAQFTEKMERNGSILIMGLPGSGKTTTSFALTDTLQNWRTYYVTLRENISDNDFVNAVESRLARQTIFLVDDCQGRFKQLNEVMNRISRLLHGRRSQALFVFLARTTPTPDLLIRGEERTDFEEELKDADAILRFTADQQTFRRIVERTRPDFGSLSDERLASLYEFTGHDLFLLDEMLQTIDDERGIDDLNLEFLFVTTLARYFGKGTVHRPGFMKLAALAQFEIAPRVGDFPIDLEREDAKAVAELVVQAGSPPRYFFLHSSAAELIFRALTRNEEIDHAGKAADYLIEYFKDRPANDQALSADLSKAIWNRLKLAEEPEEYRLKSAFLEDIYSLMERSFETLPLNLMAVCLIILRRSGSAAFERYQELTRLNAEEGTVLESAISGSFWDSSLFLRLVKKTDARLLTILRNQVSARGLLWVAQATEFQNFLLLVSAVSDAEDSTLRGSLSTIPDNQIEAMIQRTMDNRRSIGTLHSALWELKEADERLLTLLEEKIGVTRWLRLITANGSIFELFMLIKSSSLPMAERLIVALDNKVLDQLIEQTILLGRSIGTLSLALRELKQTDERLLTLLEEKIGVTRWLRLIAANGSIFELFQVIQSSSLPMAERLIVVLDDTVLDQLIEQTISSGRSIGTLDFALRELKQTDKHLLARLEEKIGVTRWLRLIAANGSIFELFRVIQRSSLPMAERLIVALDDTVLDQLIEQTVSSGRSIGTLSFALRELKQTNERLLTWLEEKIGVTRWLRLIAANGSIFELFMLIRSSSLPMAERLIVVLDDTVLDQLIEQTISSGRSIGTLDFALRELKQTDKHLLARLEEKIGVTRWLRLIAANGSILELFKVIQRSSLPMAEKLIVGLDDMVLDQLVERTILSDRSIGSLHWTLRYLKAANHIMLRQLEEKIGTVRWWRLVCSFGSIGILVDLLPAMDKSFRQRFISAAWRLSVENWQKLMLRGGFYELCRFVTGVPEFFSAKSQLDSVKPILVTSIQISNWKARDTGWRLLSAAEDSVARNYLLQLFYEEVGDIEPSALVFSTFAEVAHCVNLLCRLTPVMRKESLDVFFRFVDEGKPIYSDPEYLRSVRSLFSTLATPQVERESAHKLLNVADASAVAPVCSKATTLDLFLYLWNLYLLWFEWESAEGKSFVDFLNAEIREAVIASLGKRFSTAKQDQEARSLIMLTGLLSFLAVRFDRPNATKDFVSRLGSFDKMIDDLDEDQTFIPSVFYLLGLEWLYQKDREVPAVVWWDELGKVHDYTQRTAALDYLQSIVRKRSRLL